MGRTSSADVRRCVCGCNRMTRTNRMSAEKHPGTVVRVTKDMCKQGYDRLRRTINPPEPPPAEDPALVEARKEAEAARRLEAAFKAAETLTRQREARAARARTALLGQSAVRI